MAFFVATNSNKCEKRMKQKIYKNNKREQTSRNKLTTCVLNFHE